MIWIEIIESDYVDMVRDKGIGKRRKEETRNEEGHAHKEIKMKSACVE